ncbi:DNA-processing protein DprA [Sulfitobacter sp. S190]|uniref:DNA-processing protein DprA n=1 Tax=Sulfitobacter sp. S190 TaxID=2867022 RepID=UPI0021A820E3|nr:DNA-processing protein DprA [Sulfitobacter sp. S190]UWR23410.1 DNA-processing protein DprA [Sulfitobacter sp. S190]
MTDRDYTPSSTHPPLPPPSEDEQFARLRLLRSRRVGVATYNRLMAEHGTAQNALAALPQVARAAGVSSYEACPEGVIRAELQAARAAGARLVERGDALYPALLAEREDAPPFMWVVGDTDILTRPMISLVGARNASSLGLRMARTLAQDLSKAGYVVVSGLARGIDAAAHAAALPHGTLAVQAGGVDILYPAENAALARDIGQNGLRVSEQPMGLNPIARHFPARNRIIAGLSQATLVVEAAAKSGSLITARDAVDQGRDVLAVPGHPFDARASGCNMLIRDGATLIRNASDVIDMLTPVDGNAPKLPLPPTPQTRSAPKKRGSALREAAKLHKTILSRLGPSPIAEDQLIRDLRAAPASVTPVLIDLELDGQITRSAGGLLSRSV